MSPKGPSNARPDDRLPARSAADQPRIWMPNLAFQTNVIAGESACFER